MTQARLTHGVRLRQDEFGGLCYVPHRDDFFALDRVAFALATRTSRRYEPLGESQVEVIRPLVERGIIQLDEPIIRERAYSGPAFIGEFPELPSVSHPLVVNCFSTAWCPFMCAYCHADDLMTGAARASEREDEIGNVLSTASAIPAMVAVITGGDPLSAPERARRLIDGLAGSKAVVLDTAGLGPIDRLLETLVTHHVHVRVSIDNALSRLNDRLRPVNPAVAARTTSAFEAARNTLHLLRDAGVPTTVQSVITSANDRVDDWLRLRDVLLEWGVKNWVLHVMVSGGKARRTAQKKLSPRPDLGKNLWQLVGDTIEQDLPIDVRCTDTSDRPNSVLLIASNGDLYTEGFARKGKVKLYSAGGGRPDKVNALMAHLDRFGHARRYLNWNPWFRDGASIETVTVPVPGGAPRDAPSAVETEYKFVVAREAELINALRSLGFELASTVFQRDEYFDSERGIARQNDYVIRIRKTDSGTEIALKGPRFFSEDGAVSRLEVEVPTTSAEAARVALESRGLRCTWYLEKRRREYRSRHHSVVVALDELPQIGAFVEIEGELETARSVVRSLADGLGSPQTSNYTELALEHHRRRAPEETLAGLAFEPDK